MHVHTYLRYIKATATKGNRNVWNIRLVEYWASQKSSCKNHLNADLQENCWKSSTELYILTYMAAKARSNKRDLLFSLNNFQVYSTCYPSLNTATEEQADPLRCPTSRNKIHNHIKYWMISMTPITRVSEHITVVWCILCHRAERKIWLPLCCKWEGKTRDNGNLSVAEQGKNASLVHGQHAHGWDNQCPLPSWPDWTEQVHLNLMIPNHTDTFQSTSFITSKFLHESIHSKQFA